MDDNRDPDDEHIDRWVSNWEQQCLDEIESEPDIESQVQSELELSNQKLWYLFQNSATCIAQMYKGNSASTFAGERINDVSMWIPFQTAAGTVTSLYKESLSGLNRCTETGIAHGYQKRNREILSWAKKRRRHIRREDLIAYLCNKNPPSKGAHHHRNASRPRLSLADRTSPRLQNSDAFSHRLPAPETDLQTFRDALALSSLQGAMSAVSFRSSPASPSLSTRRRSPPHLPAIHEALNLKRPPTSPSQDTTMDSPTHKRPRMM